MDKLDTAHSENSNDWFPRIRAFRQDSKDIERASWPGNSPPVAGGASNQVKAGMQQAAAMTAGEATEPHSKRASFNVQAGALWRKNVAYQRRNIGTNVCLLCAPILFCLVLLVLQSAIGRLLKGEQSECGCQCTRCCFNGDPGNCTSITQGTCPYQCLQHNKSHCGVAFSTPAQYPFCDLDHTSSWPAILQTPSEAHRAALFKPKAALLYTGNDGAAARTLSEGMLSPPSLTPAMLLDAQTYLSSFSGDFAQLEQQQGAGTVVPGELLSLMGLQRLGTSSTVKAGLYLETALMGDNPTLYALWPDGTCARLGLEGTANTSLSTMLHAMVDASNTPALASVLNARLDNITQSFAGNGSTASAASQITNLKINCTDVVLLKASDAEELQRTLYCGYFQARCTGSSAPNAYAAAFDWRDTGATKFAPDMLYNDTYAMKEESSTVHAAYQRLPQVLNMAVNSWLQSVLGDKLVAELVGVMDMPKFASSVHMDLSLLLGSIFCTWVVQMLLPVYVMQLVYEKENRLRMMMKMHGLGDAAYWIVTYGWFAVLYAAYMIVFVFFGSVMGLSIFTKNDYGIQFILYALFGNNMIAFSFLMSCIFTSSRTVTVFAYLLVFGSGLVGSLLLSQLANGGYWYADLLEFIPSLALYRGVYELNEYSSLAVNRKSFGLAAANLSDPQNGMKTVWLILGVEWVIFMLAAWYLEQVYASGTGNKRHPLFFLEWMWRSNGRKQPARKHRASKDLNLPTIKSPIKQALQLPPAASLPGVVTVPASSPPPSPVLVKPGALPLVDASSIAAAGCEWQEPADVAAERRKVEAMQDYADHPIVVKHLQKTYPSRDGQPPKHAVRSLDLGIKRGECFGLLGPNGAGKSTSMSMMVGLIEPSGGDALIGGFDITKNMDDIYSLMGVCPQHDLLWETLTGREHLMFYGRLKGMKGAELEAAVQSSLRAVNLWANSVADKQARQYSGGMKRRLSVAISFIGDPLVVYMDEPSTGLDPASRRTLWECVKNNKRDRAIVLTTHNMEEAELLCDRLGIFVDGRLVCIGHPKDITGRHGSFLVLTITVPAEQVAAAQQMVLECLSPRAQLTYSVGGTLKFELPSSEVSLSRVFATMAGDKFSELQLLDWGVANATLEEVFIRFARQMGLKAGR